MVLLHFVIAGLRLVTGLPVDPSRFNVGFLTVSIGVLANMAIAAGSQALGIGWTFQVDPYAVLLAIGSWSAAAFVLAILAGRSMPGQSSALIAAIVAASFWVSLIYFAVAWLWALYLAPRLPPQPWLNYVPWILYIVQFVVLLMAFMRIVPKLTGRRSVVLPITMFALFTAVSLAAPAQSMVLESRARNFDAGYWPLLEQLGAAALRQVGWTATADGAGDVENEPDTVVDVETVLAKQDQLIADEIDRLAPQDPNRPELFLLGMAGDASQAVFRREVRSVEQLFGERFGTFRHSVSLINSTTTVEHVPLASPRNLGAMLKQLGSVMDKENDVLFLFMTSHGSPRRFVTRFDDMPFWSLNPKQVRKQLDASGIKHRVIVISACYSGSFIKDLKGPNTLIMTAARPDRTSFGCADENEWTYFGDAYFNNALRATTSFVDAFKTASALVATWEKRDDVTPSEPQIDIGTNIQATLARLAFAAVASAAAPAPAQPPPSD
jgi:Peptidase C13 family